MTFITLVLKTFTKKTAGRMLTVIGACWLALSAGQASAQVLRTDEPDFLVVGAGGFDINDDMTAAEFDAQFRLNTRLWIFRPQVGLFATTDSAFYAYAGIYSDFHLGDSVVLSPSISVGGFHEGDGKDLGGAIEFRSAIELAYKFENQSRLGLQFGHLSNASIYDSNPGEEFLILNYSIPVTVFDR
jgi:hypothetical protein